MSHARVAFSTTAISSRPRADQPRDRVVGVLDAVRALGGRLVAADLRLQPQVLDHRVEHRRGRQRGAGVVEVGDATRCPACPRGPGRRRRSRLARRDHQVVEDLRRQPRLEQRAVDLLQREVAAERVLEPRPSGCRRGSALASSVRLNQPNQFASSSSPLHADVGEARAAASAARGRRGRTRGRRPPTRARARRRRRSAAAPLRGRRPRPHRPAPQRRGAHGGALRPGGDAVALARRLAGEEQRPAGAQHARELGERARRASGRWCSTAWPSTRSNDVVRERQLGGVAGGGLDARARARARWPRASRACRARCRCRWPCSTTPGLQEVEREVAGARADLERARERAGRRAEQLA